MAIKLLQVKGMELILSTRRWGLGTSGPQGLDGFHWFQRRGCEDGQKNLLKGNHVKQG